MDFGDAEEKNKFEEPETESQPLTELMQEVLDVMVPNDFVKYMYHVG